MKDLIKSILDKYGLRMSFIKERKDYHPEYSLLQHILTVIDNVKQHESKELTIAALFHDIGKVYTYEEFGNSYDHEKTSAYIVKEYHDDITKLNADVDQIIWIVANHIRIGRLMDNAMSLKKQKTLKEHKWWLQLRDFYYADDMLDDHAKSLDRLLNKDIYVTTNDRELLTGKCTFLGHNEFVTNKQVTINRTPIRINNYNQVCSYYNPFNNKFELS